VLLLCGVNKRGSILGRGNDFSLYRHLQISFKPHPVWYPTGAGCLFLRVDRQEREAHLHLLLTFRIYEANFHSPERLHGVEFKHRPQLEVGIVRKNDCASVHVEVDTSCKRYKY
jgi:hypothetical protein